MVNPTTLSLIDTHCHLYADAFDTDREEMVIRALSNGVTRLLLPNISLDSIEGMLSLCRTFPKNCLPMMGLHPCDVKEGFEQVLKEMEKLLQPGHPFVAIGETGLDLYWDKSTLPQQILSLEQHLRWSQQYHLPIVLHARDSMDPLLEVIESPEFRNTTRGVFHCFIGTQEQAERVIALGYSIGLGGVVTFKNSGLAPIVATLPSDSIILETDAPYLAPVPHRGKRNESAYLVSIAEKIAEIRGESLETVASYTTANAIRLFGLTH
jgi:TatD DNase family protein